MVMRYQLHGINILLLYFPFACLAALIIHFYKMTYFVPHSWHGDYHVFISYSTLVTFLVLALKAGRVSKMNLIYDVTVSLRLSVAQWTKHPASDGELSLLVLILSQAQNVNSPLHTPHENLKNNLANQVDWNGCVPKLKWWAPQLQWQHKLFFIGKLSTLFAFLPTHNNHRKRPEAFGLDDGLATVGWRNCFERIW